MSGKRPPPKELDAHQKSIDTEPCKSGELIVRSRTDNEIELVRFLRSTPELKLWLSDGELRYRAPKGLVTDSVLKLIRSNKSAIIKILQGRTNLQGERRQQPEFRARKPAKIVRMKFHDGLWKRRHLFGVDYTNGPMIMRIVQRRLEYRNIRDLIKFMQERHDLLRGRFEDLDGAPVLVEDASYTVPVYIRGEIGSVGAWPGCEVRFDDKRDENESTADWASRMAWKPLDPSDEPWRVLIAPIDETSFFLGFVFHHFICDFYALPAITNEIEAAYDAIERGEDPRYIKASLNYNDYIIALEEFLGTSTGLSNLAYWEQTLKGSPGTFLPNDDPGSCDETGNDRVTLYFPAEKFRQVTQLCAQLNCTPAMAVLAAQFWALQQLSGSNDLTIWNIRVGRTDSALVDLFGNLVDEVPYRVLLPDTFTGIELLQTVRDVVLEAEEHLPYPSVLMREIMSRGGANPEAPNLNFNPPKQNDPEAINGDSPGILSPIGLNAPPQTTRISRNHIYPYSVRATIVNGHLVGQLIYPEHRYTKVTIDGLVNGIYEALDKFVQS